MNELKYDAHIELDGKLWFIPHRRPLCYMDIVANRCYLAESINDIEYKTVGGEILNDSNSLLWCTQDGDSLIEYNILEKKYYSYKLPCMKYKDWYAVTFIFKYNREIYIIPKYSSKIITFDLATKTFKEKNVKHRLFSDEEKPIKACGILNRKLICVFDNPVQLIGYDLITEKICDYDLCALGGKYYSLFQDNNYLHISTDKGVIIFDGNTETITDIKYWPNSNDYKGKLLVTENKYYVFPHGKSSIYIFDRMLSEPIIFEDFPYDFRFNDIVWAKFLEHYCGEKYIWLNNRSANYSFRINMDIEEIELYKPENFGEELFLMQDIKSNGIVVEKSNNYLNKFLEVVR